MADTTLAFNILTRYRDAGATAAARDMDRVGRSASKLGESLSKAVKGGALLAGGLAGAGLAKGFSDALSNMDAGAKLQAQLGLTEKQSARAGKVAGSLYSNAYGDSLATVNDAVRRVVQDTGTSLGSVNLEGITGKVLSLSDTFDQDLGGVTRAVGQLMRTGLAKNASQALDIVARGFQTGADKSEDFLDTLNEYGTQFRKLGLSGAQATGLISQGLKAGARDGDLVADALKEFSIRAIDGSEATVAGFEELGLSAKDMQKQIAGGGKGATKGLDTVLDKLRAIKDPAKQAAVATALFGTQSEDLGKALFALDPSKAVSTLGKVRGAAAKVDKTVGATASATLTSFKRSVETNIADGMASAITGFQTGKAEGDGFIGAMSEVGVKAKQVGQVLVSVGGFLDRHRSIVVGVVGAYVAWKVATIAMSVASQVSLLWLKLHTVGTIQHTVVSKTAAAAAKVWAAGQWLLNAALTANPIGLVVVAIAGLVAGVVIAYKKSDKFREIVDKAWSVIKKSVHSAWSGVIKPALKAFSRFITDDLMPNTRNLWNKVIRPIFSAIGKGIAGTWRNVIRPILKAWKSYFTDILFPVIKFLWNNVVKPYFKALGSGIAATWTNVVRPVFKALKDYISDTLVPAFRKGIGAIGKIWRGLSSAAKAPVKFLVNTIYNDGIRKMIGLLPGVGTPDRVDLGFSRGGHTGPGERHKVAGIVHADEFVLSKPARRQLESKQPGALNYMNTTGKWPGFFLGGRVPLPGATSVAQHSSAEYPWATWAGDLNKPNDAGAPIVSWKDGFVAGMHFLGDRSYGRYATINHDGTSTLYAHMARFASGLEPGSPIKAGQTVGYVGDIGNAQGTHLHFELKGGGAPTGSTNDSGGGEGWFDAIGKIKSIISKIKGGISSLGKMPGPWAPLLTKSARSMGSSASQWLNDKIPNRFLPDNPIPRFAHGGYVKARPGGMLAVVGDGPHDELISPVRRGRSGGGGGPTINITINGALDPVAVGRQVEQVLIKYTSATGRPLRVRTT
jgi:phage-related minor tail protein